MIKKNIWLIGGFGNVLFQIVFLKKLCAEGFEINIYPIFTKNNFITKNVLRWKVHNTIYKSMFNNLRYSNKGYIFAFFAFLFFFISKIKNRSFNKFLFTPSGSDLQENYYNSLHFMGYYQSKEFLSKNKHYVRQVISELKNHIQFLDGLITVYHFRGSDSPHLKENLMHLKSIIKNEKKLTIITDDPDCIKKNINLFNSNSKIISDSVLNDFISLSSAKKKLYTTNSTFSWWASNLVSRDCTVYMSRKMYDNLGYYGDGSLVIV
jgi:hypothetical protein